MEFKANNELTIKEIDSIKETIKAVTAENRADILKAFDDMELQRELKKRGAICSVNAWQKAEIECLKTRINELEQDNSELLEYINNKG